MIRYIIVSITSGILFGFLDGVINGNPYAQKPYECYKPIANTSVCCSNRIVGNGDNRFFVWSHY